MTLNNLSGGNFTSWTVRLQETAWTFQGRTSRPYPSRRRLALRLCRPRRSRPQPSPKHRRRSRSPPEERTVTAFGPRKEGPHEDKG